MPPDRSDWQYDYDKIPIERMLLAEAEVRTTIFRLPAVYGPRDYRLRVWELCPKVPKRILTSHERLDLEQQKEVSRRASRSTGTFKRAPDEPGREPPGAEAG
jgi:nucleoside-diphosphate-sugar epimerase